MYRLLYGKAENSNENVEQSTESNQETVPGSTSPATNDNGENEGAGSTTDEGQSEGTGITGFAGRTAGHLLSVPGTTRIDYERSRDTIVRRIVDLVRTTNRSSKLISSVTRTRSRIELERVFSLYEGRCSTALFKWFIIHGDHIHIVHDCTYSNGSCRCFNKFPFERRTRRIVSSQSLSEQDYKLLVQYHFEAGRKCKSVSVGNTNYTRLFLGLESVRSTESSAFESGNEGDVERCDYQDESLWQQLIRGPPDEHGEESIDGSHQGSPETKRRRRRGAGAEAEEKEKQQVRLEKFIMGIGKVPLQDFVTTTDFLNSEWKFHNDMSTIFKNAIKYAKFRFFNFGLRDYRDFYENLEILPYWDTTNRENFSSKYLPLEQSKKILYKLLIWQNHDSNCMTDIETGTIREDFDWKPNVYQYVKSLIELLDKKRGKTNTDLYVSAPNAGKTLFMDLIRDYLINCGQMLNWNRNSNFPLQNCGYTRCIFWNEPNYEQSVERNLLKLLGGDSLNAAVKNQMDVNIEKTPVFVTSNNYPFPKSPEFNFRIKYYTWKSAPFLKSIGGKKFHPLTFQCLINDCENYFKEDITQYQLKYTDKEYNLLRTLNVFDYSEIVDTDIEDDNKTDDDNESVTSDL